MCSFVPVFDYVDALRERERWCYCVLPPPIVPGVSLLYRYRIGWLFIYSCKQRHLTKNETTKRERRRESERDDIQSDIIRIHSRKRRHRGREMIKAKAWITSNRHLYGSSLSLLFSLVHIEQRPIMSMNIVSSSRAYHVSYPQLACLTSDFSVHISQLDLRPTMCIREEVCCSALQ